MPYSFQSLFLTSAKAFALETQCAHRHRPWPSFEGPYNIMHRQRQRCPSHGCPQPGLRSCPSSRLRRQGQRSRPKPAGHQAGVATNIHGDGGGVNDERTEAVHLHEQQGQVSPLGSAMKRTGENCSQSNTPDPSSGWTPGTPPSPGWWDGEGQGLHPQPFPRHLCHQLCPFSWAENLPHLSWSNFSSLSPSHRHKLEFPQEISAPGNLSASYKKGKRL